MVIKYENRLIAFLDVLGFSAQLEAGDIDGLHEKYASYIDQAKNATFFGAQGDAQGRKNFDFSQFLFDSIVLVSCPVDDVFNVNNFVAAVSLLLELGFKNRLPLRGAISLGDFLYDSERNIFLSERFPELAKFELKQEWAGCSILEHAEQLILDCVFMEGVTLVDNVTREQPVHRYPVPLKGGAVVNYLVLNYMFFLSESEILNGIDFLIKRKKDEVVKYFEFLIGLPVKLQVLTPDFHPAKYAYAMMTRSGVRFKFTDENHEPCSPNLDSVQIVAKGRWK
ncbi:hypothetical protein [Pseudomonas sp. B11(2017)]|uniref:hypothetical protein n=1 Tax=Pseudomonas sp. B11(2017) TaxID=1981748 RepID=UPI00111C6ACD|nr:hypothetical protein [Pseudomonas sp. B11(2017)]